LLFLPASGFADRSGEKNGIADGGRRPKGVRALETEAEANPVSAPATLADVGIDKREMADLIKRLNEISGDDPQIRTPVRHGPMSLLSTIPIVRTCRIDGNQR